MLAAGASARPPARPEKQSADGDFPTTTSRLQVPTDTSARSFGVSGTPALELTKLRWPGIALWA